MAVDQALVLGGGGVAGIAPYLASATCPRDPLRLFGAFTLAASTDGGVRSSDNADLAEGAARIIVSSPLGLDCPLPSPLPLREVVARLRAGGAGSR